MRKIVIDGPNAAEVYDKLYSAVMNITPKGRRQRQQHERLLDAFEAHGTPSSKEVQTQNGPDTIDWFDLKGDAAEILIQDDDYEVLMKTFEDLQWMPRATRMANRAFDVLDAAEEVKVQEVAEDNA